MPSAQSLGLPPPNPAEVEAFRRGGRRHRFVYDRKSFREFMTSEQVRSPVADVAHEISALAKSTAVRGTDAGQHFADDFYVEREAGAIKVNRAFRVKVEVRNDNPVALYNEFGVHADDGGEKRQKRHALRNAGAAFGDLKLKKDD